MENDTRLSPKPEITTPYQGLLQLSVILLVLYIISFFNYVLFHSFAEFIRIAITTGIFFVVWNSRQFLQNNYFLFLGVALFAVALLDLLHLFTYKGIHIIETGGNSNIATQLWIAARYLVSLSYLIAPIFIKRKINAQVLLASYLAVTLLIILSIFFWKIFPLAYQDGVGLTPFKVYSEYIITLIFAAALFSLYRFRQTFDSRIYRLLMMVIITMIVSELMFTLYVGVYDFFNLLGHLLMIVTVYLSYLSILEYSLKKPYRSMFKSLKDSEMALKFEKTKLNNILDSMADGVVMIDSQYNILYANPSLIKNFGPRHPDQKCHVYFHGIEQPCAWCKNQEIFQGQTVRWEHKFSKINRTFDLIDTPIQTPEGQPAKLELFHDITERKEIEKSKDEFISLASHQLRTPLASISLSSELLLRGTAGPVGDEQKNYLQEIYQSTKKMAALVNNLLNISRIEMGNFALNREPVDVQAIIEQILNEVDISIEDKKLVLKKSFAPNLPVIQSDSGALHTLVENIISNAIRYTPAEGIIRVQTSLDNGMIKIEISDTGCGIPADQQSQIFSKSFRATNAIQTNADGTGLGLYMVKSIADKLGYMINFSSEENKGTTFWIEIPVK